MEEENSELYAQTSVQYMMQTEDGTMVPVKMNEDGQYVLQDHGTEDSAPDTQYVMEDGTPVSTEEGNESMQYVVQNTDKVQLPAGDGDAQTDSYQNASENIESDLGMKTVDQNFQDPQDTGTEDTTQYIMDPNTGTIYALKDGTATVLEDPSNVVINEPADGFNLPTQTAQIIPDPSATSTQQTVLSQDGDLSTKSEPLQISPPVSAIEEAMQKASDLELEKNSSGTISSQPMADIPPAIVSVLPSTIASVSLASDENAANISKPISPNPMKPPCGDITQLPDVVTSTVTSDNNTPTNQTSTSQESNVKLSQGSKSVASDKQSNTVKSSIVKATAPKSNPKKSSQTKTIFKCELCDYRSSQKTEVYQHLLKLHTKAHNHKCSKCGLKFMNESSKHKHEIACDYVIFGCAHCSFTASDKASLVEHLEKLHNPQQHILRCSACSFTSTSDEVLQKHILTHHKQQESKTEEVKTYEENPSTPTSSSNSSSMIIADSPGVNLVEKSDSKQKEMRKEEKKNLSYGKKAENSGVNLFEKFNSKQTEMRKDEKRIPGYGTKAKNSESTKVKEVKEFDSMKKDVANENDKMDTLANWESNRESNRQEEVKPDNEEIKQTSANSQTSDKDIKSEPKSESQTSNKDIKSEPKSEKKEDPKLLSKPSICLWRLEKITSVSEAVELITQKKISLSNNLLSKLNQRVHPDSCYRTINTKRKSTSQYARPSPLQTPQAKVKALTPVKVEQTKSPGSAVKKVVEKQSVKSVLSKKSLEREQKKISSSKPVKRKRVIKPSFQNRLYASYGLSQDEEVKETPGDDNRRPRRKRKPKLFDEDFVNPDYMDAESAPPSPKSDISVENYESDDIEKFSDEDLKMELKAEKKGVKKISAADELEDEDIDSADEFDVPKKKLPKKKKKKNVNLSFSESDGGVSDDDIESYLKEAESIFEHGKRVDEEAEAALRQAEADGSPRPAKREKRAYTKRKNKPPAASRGFEVKDRGDVMVVYGGDEEEDDEDSREEMLKRYAQAVQINDHTMEEGKRAIKRKSFGDEYVGCKVEGPSKVVNYLMAEKRPRGRPPKGISQDGSFDPNLLTQKKPKMKSTGSSNNPFRGPGAPKFKNAGAPIAKGQVKAQRRKSDQPSSCQQQHQVRVITTSAATTTSPTSLFSNKSIEQNYRVVRKEGGIMLIPKASSASVSMATVATAASGSITSIITSMSGELRTAAGTADTRNASPTKDPFMPVPEPSLSDEELQLCPTQPNTSQVDDVDIDIKPNIASPDDASKQTTPDIQTACCSEFPEPESDLQISHSNLENALLVTESNNSQQSMFSQQSIDISGVLSQPDLVLSVCESAEASDLEAVDVEVCSPTGDSEMDFFSSRCSISESFESHSFDLHDSEAQHLSKDVEEFLDTQPTITLASLNTDYTDVCAPYIDDSTANNHPDCYYPESLASLNSNIPRKSGLWHSRKIKLGKGMLSRSKSFFPTPKLPLYDKEEQKMVKKCRKVYGLENRGSWCVQCKWKKACTRFMKGNLIH